MAREQTLVKSQGRASEEKEIPMTSPKVRTGCSGFQRSGDDAANTHCTKNTAPIQFVDEKLFGLGQKNNNVLVRVTFNWFLFFSSNISSGPIISLDVAFTFSNSEGNNSISNPRLPGVEHMH